MIKGALNINLGSVEKIIRGARRSGLNFEGSREPRPSHAKAQKWVIISLLLVGLGKVAYAFN